MATAAAANGKLEIAQSVQVLSIPEGWAQDASGNHFYQTPTS
jgi:LDH2 family malate/lactate/ureidoglycolate dehydrogenase